MSRLEGILVLNAELYPQHYHTSVVLLRDVVCGSVSSVSELEGFQAGSVSQIRSSIGLSNNLLTMNMRATGRQSFKHITHLLMCNDVMSSKIVRKGSDVVPLHF